MSILSLRLVVFVVRFVSHVRICKTHIIDGDVSPSAKNHQRVKAVHGSYLSVIVTFKSLKSTRGSIHSLGSRSPSLRQDLTYKEGEVLDICNQIE